MTQLLEASSVCPALMSYGFSVFLTLRLLRRGLAPSSPSPFRENPVVLMTREILEGKANDLTQDMGALTQDTGALT